MYLLIKPHQNNIAMAFQTKEQVNIAFKGKLVEQGDMLYQAELAWVFTKKDWCIADEVPITPAIEEDKE